MTDLPAGRDLDALVAEKMMGWITGEHNGRKVIGPPVGNMGPIGDPGVWAYADEVPVDWILPYSTSIAAAWQVVEEIKRRGLHWWIADCSGGYGAHVRFEHDRRTFASAEAETLPLAICRAALKVVGG